MVVITKEVMNHMVWVAQHLIHGTLSNLPIYFMSIFQLPRVVRMRLEQIQRDFLWRGGALE